MAMKTSTIKYLLLLVFLAPAFAHAQGPLTLERAIALAMSHNHGIQIANNDVDAASNAVHPGNAGLLPTVAVNGSYNYSNNNTTIQFATEPTAREINGAASTTLVGSLGLNYTLFNGLGTFYNYQKLQAAESLSEASARLTIENTLIQVLNGYYTLAQAQDNLKTSVEALSISAERLERAKTAAKFGVQSQLQVLNAQVDLNTDSIKLVNSQLALVTAQRNINFLLGNKAPEDLTVDTEVAYRSDLTVDGLRNQALNNNASMLMAAQSLALSELDLKSSRSNQYPVIGLNASYGYNGNQSDASLVLSNESVGFTGGLSLNFSLFDGRKRNIAIQNAKIDLESNLLRQEQARLQVERDVLNAWSTYQTRLAVLNAQQTSVTTATRNFDRTEQQHQLGQVTSTQFREAQLNLIRTQNSLNGARYQAKLSELECLRIAGMLIK